MEVRLRRVVLGGLFIALGILLPIVFHMVGLGKVFLPMHIPVLLGGFFCGPAIGTLVGIVTPLLSSVLTGMPPLMPPTAQAMVFELGIYGLLTGVTFQRFKMNVYASTAISILGGRIVYGLLGYLFLPLLGFPKIPCWAPLIWAFTQSFPGIILQFVSVPLIVSLARKDVWAAMLAKTR